MADGVRKDEEFSGTREVEERHRINEANLGAWMQENVDDNQGPLKVLQFKGGQSNPTYKLETPGRNYVMRRKPFDTREEAEKYSAQRRGQIGTGGREEKIRTYNFPQNRVTDHRVGLTLYNLDRVMDGDLGELIQSLKAADVANSLSRGSFARPAQAPARFKPGDRVRTKNIHPATHTRLPRYARGKTGVIEAIRGCHVFPDTVAIGEGENPQWLYTLLFEGPELWGDNSDPSLKVSIEAFEPYLELA